MHSELNSSASLGKKRKNQSGKLFSHFMQSQTLVLKKGEKRLRVCARVRVCISVFVRVCG